MAAEQELNFEDELKALADHRAQLVKLFAVANVVARKTVEAKDWPRVWFASGAASNAIRNAIDAVDRLRSTIEAGREDYAPGYFARLRRARAAEDEA